MPDIASNTVARYRVIVTKDDGTQEHLPLGMQINVTVVAASGAAACRAEVGAMADGGLAVVLTPTKQAEPNVSVTITDPAGVLKPFTLSVNIVLSGAPPSLAGTLGLDTSSPELSPQPLPPA